MGRGRTRQTYYARVRFRKKGSLPRPEFDAGIRAAQQENARWAQRLAREFARARVKRSPSVNNRGSRRYAKSMLDSYETRMIDGGRTFSLRNTTLRGRAFEAGARAHVIRRGKRIVPGQPLAFRHPKPNGPMRFRAWVNHPGQRGRWPMRDAVRHGDRHFQTTIDRHIGREMGRG